jgi:hypothetical protein
MITHKRLNMESDERNNKKKIGDTESCYRKLSKPIRVRPTGFQIDTINEGLLDYNVYIVFLCGPILYLLFSII